MQTFTLFAAVLGSLVLHPAAHALGRHTPASELADNATGNSTVPGTMSCVPVLPQFIPECSVRGFRCERTVQQIGDVVLCNGTAVTLCPEGSFCPTPMEISDCPRGHFCRVASYKPSACFLSAVSCPDVGMAEPQKGWVALFLFIVLGLIAMIAKIAFYFYYDRFVKRRIDPIDYLRMEQSATLKLSKTLYKMCNASNNNRSNSWRAASNAFDKVETSLSDSGRHLIIKNRDLESANSEIRVDLEQIPIPENIRMNSDSSDSSSSHQPANLREIMMIVQRHRRSQRSGVRAEPFSFRRIESPMSIDFADLNFRLKGSSKCILQDISGSIQGGAITALMGPSGSGKTTLLTLLRGRAHYGKVEGSIFVNGMKVKSLKEFSRTIGFAPQDDIMYDDLTVEENLIYAAILFNKRGYYDERAVMPMVRHVLDMLGLDFVRHSIVGNAESKGISGGQKKRVSVGMEFVKEPALLLLDEPTSGLDAATSISLLHSLHHLSNRGVTIVATIHQPRREIFELFDYLILLAPEGRLVYCGRAASIVAHLHSIHYDCPPQSNPADFMMDILAGSVKPTNARKPPPVTIIHKQLARAWRERALALPMAAQVSSTADFVYPRDIGGSHDKYWMLFYRVFKVVLLRELRRANRSFNTFVIDNAVMFIIGALIALLFGEMLIGSSSFTSQITGMELTFGILTMQQSLRLFGNDTVVRHREEESGIICVAYFFGKLCGSLHYWIVPPLVYLCGYYTLLFPRGSFLDYYWFLLLLNFAIQGLGNFLAVLLNKKQRGVVASGLIVLLWAFGGISPTRDELEQTMGAGGLAMSTLSMYTLSYKLHVLSEFFAYPPALRSWAHPNADEVLAKLGYHWTDWDVTQQLLFAYGVAGNALALFWLIWSRDDFGAWRSIRHSISHAAKAVGNKLEQLLMRNGRNGNRGNSDGTASEDDTPAVPHSQRTNLSGESIEIVPSINIPVELPQQFVNVLGVASPVEGDERKDDLEVPAAA